MKKIHRDGIFEKNQFQNLNPRNNKNADKLRNNTALQKRRNKI